LLDVSASLSIFGSTFSDFLVGGNQGDLIHGGFGADFIHMGGVGAASDGVRDVASGTLAELDGDTIEQIGTEDVIKVVGAALTGAQVRLTEDLLEIDGDIDGAFETAFIVKGPATFGTAPVLSVAGGDTEISFASIAANGAPVAGDDAGATDANLPIELATLLDNDSDPDGDAFAIFDLQSSSIFGAGLSVTGGVVTYDPTASAALRALAPGEIATDGFYYRIEDELGGQDTSWVTMTVTGVDTSAFAASDDAAAVLVNGAVIIDALANDGGPAVGALSLSGFEQGALGGIVTLTPDGKLRYDASDLIIPLAPGETVTDRFSYTVIGPDGEEQDAEIAVAVSVPAVRSYGNFMGEVGTISLTNAWTTITLRHSYENPVVIARVMSETGTGALTVRLRDVAGDGMSLRLQETRDLDGIHGAEQVAYLVVEAGRYTLEDGTRIEAGTIASNAMSLQRFDALAFGTEFADAPLTFSQVQTYRGADFVTTRHGTVNAAGMTLALEEDEFGNTVNPAHATETVGWLAVDRTTSLAGQAAETSAGSDPVFTAFATDFADAAPILFASLIGNQGPDAATARVSSVSPDGFVVRVQEDQSRDTETVHGTEAIGFLAFGQEGDLFADHAPVAQDDFFSVMETGTLTIQPTHMTGNDADLETWPVQLGLVSTAGLLGTLTARADGAYDYTPGAAFAYLDEGEVAYDAFSYQAKDATGAIDWATAMIEVTGAADLIAVSDTYLADRDLPLFGNLLANDIDPQGGEILEIEINGVPKAGGGSTALDHGRLILDRAGNFVYAPDTDAPRGGWTESFGYRIIDDQGDTAEAQVTFEVRDAIGEVGQAEIGVEGLIIALTRSYLDPVIILSINSLNDADPIAARVRWSTSSHMEIMIQESTELDNLHVAETVSWMVVEAGVWDLGGGVVLEADTIDTNNLARHGFENVAHAADFDGDVATLTQVQSFTGTSFVRTRQQFGDEDGFQVMLEEEQAQNGGGHSTETVGWVSMGIGATTAGNGALEIGKINPGVPDEGHFEAFGVDFDDAPILFTQMAGRYGIDPAAARALDVTADGFFVFAEEDTSVDAETDHAPEIVDWFAFEDYGLIYARDLLSQGVNDAPVARADFFTTDEERGVSGILFNDHGAGADSDIEGDNLVVHKVNFGTADVGVSFDLPEGGRVRVMENGQFWFNPLDDYEYLDEGETATPSFIYTISDRNGGFSQATVEIEVSGISYLPVLARDDAAARSEYGTLTFDFLNNDYENPDDEPEVIGVSFATSGPGSYAGPIGGILTLNSDGRSITFDPDGDFEYLRNNEREPFEFTYEIEDHNGTRSTGTVTFEVVGDNDQPVAFDDHFVWSLSGGNAPMNVFADNGSGADYDVDIGDTLEVRAFKPSSYGVYRSDDATVNLPTGGTVKMTTEGDILLETTSVEGYYTGGGELEAGEQVVLDYRVQDDFEMQSYVAQVYIDIIA
jgi:VCBS repeat-containing protein